MKKNQQRLVRILALVLVLLLVLSTILSVVFSAYAEAAPERDAYEINISYMEDEQALRISQRLVYHNRASYDMDRVIFYAAGNMFRRESALMYESDVLPGLFPDGFAPSGIDLTAVRVNGEAAQWAFQGTDETALRVRCNLAPGESCVFEFDYFLLLSASGAFIGQGETDVRLSAFCFIPGMPDETYREFSLNPMLQHTRWLWTEAADYRVTLTLPDLYLPAATGTQTLLSSENHTNVWQLEADNVREFALSFGKRYREATAVTDSGVTVRLLSTLRGSADQVLEQACSLIGVYEDWLGPFPVQQIDLVQSDHCASALNFPGTVWIPQDILTDAQQLRSALGFCLAQQYIGLSACPAPVSDAWLSDVPCAYLSLLAVEELEGFDAFLAALNDQVLDALRITIPGGLYVTADAGLFTQEEYDVIVRDRGTVVMHELRVAMGRDALIDALRAFYEMGLSGRTLGEYDFVAALDSVTGGDWEDFLTEWLFNVDDYIDQQIEYYE